MAAAPQAKYGKPGQDLCNTAADGADDRPRADAVAAESASDARERISAEHELDVQHHKPQRGKGRVGSLENPEVYDNVPGS